MQVADELEVRTPAQRLVEVHGTAARQHEDMLDALLGDELHDVVRQLDGAHGRGKPFAGTESGEPPATSASTTSRTEPPPLGRVVTTAALASAAGCASAGATASPQISRADTSLTSSPMKQTSSSPT